MTQNGSPTAQSPKQVVIDFLTYMGSNDLDDVERAGALFADDVVFTIIGKSAISGTMVGREEIMEKRFRQARKRMVPGSKSLEIGVVVTEGEYVAAEWKSRRRVVDNPDYENVFFGLFQVKEGKIKLLREYLDTLAVYEARWGHVDASKPTINA